MVSSPINIQSNQFSALKDYLDIDKLLTWVLHCINTSILKGVSDRYIAHHQTDPSDTRNDRAKPEQHYHAPSFRHNHQANL